MIISLSEYNNSLDKVENQFISSSAAELTKEEFAKQIRILLERATATGVHLANREVKKLESRKIKKFSERV
jgi:ribulose bisphosphate carboxylase small subunit